MVFLKKRKPIMVTGVVSVIELYRFHRESNEDECRISLSLRSRLLPILYCFVIITRKTYKVGIVISLSVLDGRFKTIQVVIQSCFIIIKPNIVSIELFFNADWFSLVRHIYELSGALQVNVRDNVLFLGITGTLLHRHQLVLAPIESFLGECVQRCLAPETPERVNRNVILTIDRPVFVTVLKYCQ